MTVPGDIDRERILRLKQREDAAFVAARPRSAELWERAKVSMPNGVPMSWLRTSYDHPPLFVAEGKGARFRDADGHEYPDFNIADMSMFAGYAPEPVVDAVSRRVAQGTQFLLPNEDGLWVAEELARRYGLPKWQFTLSATHANTEVIRVARALTGRDKVLFFDGKYHGHFDEALVDLQDGRLVPEEGGLPRGVTSKTKVVQFNDVEAVRAALEPRDVAVVITEPTLTNNVGLLLPDPGFHDALRAITRETGTVLVYDETHTQVVGPGGLTRMWSLAARHRDDREVHRRRRAARRVRHDRGRRRHSATAGRTVRREGGHRDRRDAVRQPALHGRGAGDDGRGAHRATRTPTRTRWAAGWPTGFEKAIGDAGSAVDHAPVLAARRA